LSFCGDLNHFERKLENLKNIRYGTLPGKIDCDVRVRSGERFADLRDTEQKVQHYNSKIDGVQEDIECRADAHHIEL